MKVSSTSAKPALPSSSNTVSHTQPQCNTTCEHSRLHNDLRKRDTPSLWYEYWQTNELCKDDLGGHRYISSACGDLQVIQLNGDGWTLGGRVSVSITRQSDFGVIWAQDVVASHFDGFRDGSWGAQTNVLDCGITKGPHPPTAAFMAAFDQTTKRWSQGIDITVGCAFDIQIHGASL
jgi:hypothetical protein